MRERDGRKGSESFSDESFNGNGWHGVLTWSNEK